MTEKTVESLDIEGLGTVKLESGAEVEIPRLTNARVIRLAKFIVTDGMKLLEDVGDFDALSEMEIATAIASGLEESQIAKLLNIILDIDEGKALQIDFIDTLELIQAFAEKTNLKKAFTIVQNMVKMFSRKQQQAAQKTAVNAPAKTATN